MPSVPKNRQGTSLFRDSLGPLPLAVLVIGLFATLVVALVLEQSARARAREQFLFNARRAVSEIEARADAYISMLRGAAGLFTTHPDTTAPEFHNFVERLRIEDLYPGIQAFGYTRLFPVGEQDALEASQHAHGRPGFRVWARDDNPQPPEMRSAILYTEPQNERNLNAVGYDMYADPTRRAVMDRARDTGRPVSSPILRLLQETGPDPQPGLIMFVPVYAGGGIPALLADRRERIRGFAFGGFRARDLFAGIFNRNPPRVSFSIYDGDNITSANLLYRYREDGGHASEFTALEHLSVAGRRWSIVFGSTPELETELMDPAVLVAIVAGLLLTLGLVFLVVTQRHNHLQREQLLQAERAAREESERVGRMKDEFLATLSHELRTPLTAILGWAELLRNGQLDTADHEAGMEIIERNARMQSELINDLLDMSRIISGKIRLEPEPTDLLQVAHAAVEVVQPMADARQCEIVVRMSGEPVPVVVDPQRLQQVVWNLLTNAVKFTSQGGRIDLSVNYQGENVELAVKDNGRGIDGDFLPHVFDRFRQADSSSTRQYAGLGLGLSIVKSIVELHGGSVTAHSDGTGHGAVFTVRLPVGGATGTAAAGAPQSVEAPHALPAQLSSTSLARIDVVLVEDDRDSRDLIASMLRSRGATVRAFSSAEDALDRLADAPPSLIVSDIGMPGMDGYAFIREVRGRPGIADVPAIALTAFARAQDREKALAAGYQLHVAKPVNVAALVNACAGLVVAAKTQ